MREKPCRPSMFPLDQCSERWWQVAEGVELIDQSATMLIKGLLCDMLRLGTGHCNVV